MLNSIKIILNIFYKSLFIFFTTLPITNVIFASDDNECPKTTPTVNQYSNATLLTNKVIYYLNNSGAKVALLGRLGSNAPKERFYRKIGLWNYTHAGLVYLNDNKWTVIHLINTCKEKSAIFKENLKQFFLDNPYKYHTVVAIPTTSLQLALSELITKKNLAKSYHNNSIYSSVSYPLSLERQNSNEYILDFIVAAIAWQEGRVLYNRIQAKNFFLNSHYRKHFKAEAIKVGFWEYLGISLGFGPNNATLCDHPENSKESGEYLFVSVGSLIQFLININMLASYKELSL